MSPDSELIFSLKICYFNGVPRGEGRAKMNCHCRLPATTELLPRKRRNRIVYSEQCMRVKVTTSARRFKWLNSWTRNGANKNEIELCAEATCDRKESLNCSMQNWAFVCIKMRRLNAGDKTRNAIQAIPAVLAQAENRIWVEDADSGHCDETERGHFLFTFCANMIRPIIKRALTTTSQRCLCAVANVYVAFACLRPLPFSSVAVSPALSQYASLPPSLHFNFLNLIKLHTGRRIFNYHIHAW